MTKNKDKKPAYVRDEDWAKQQEQRSGSEGLAEQEAAESSSASSTLQSFAWLELFAGAFGGTLIIFLMQTIMGTIIGVAIILQAGFFWAVMMVVAEMADNLAHIRKNTST